MSVTLQSWRKSLARAPSALCNREPSLGRRVLCALLFAIGLGISAGLGGNWGDALGQTAGPPPTFLPGSALTPLPDITPPPADEFRPPTRVGRGTPPEVPSTSRPEQSPDATATGARSPGGAASSGEIADDGLPDFLGIVESLEQPRLVDSSQPAPLNLPGSMEARPSGAPLEGTGPGLLVTGVAALGGGIVLGLILRRRRR